MIELIVDNFAGGGGASHGIEAALGRPIDIAINHDAEAIAMHQANHPHTRHLCEDVWQVDPVEATQGRPVGLAWFSPDCKHFSKAKGGKPVSKKVRGLAWVVIRWAKAVKPRVIMLENVEEFQTWGPVLADGKPCQLRKGFTFRRWCASLERLGYVVETKELRACDYGAPTTRKRLFIIARCDGAPIVWPHPTHGKGRLPYRTAAECIDWSLRCPSIFERERPLAEATLRRIARGVMKYVVNCAEPFIVGIDNRSNGARDAWPSSEPLRTTTAENRFALAVPALINTRNGERHGRHGEQAPRVRDIQQPLPTVTAQGSQGALVAAFLARHYGGHENDGASLQQTMFTVTAKDHHALVASSIVKLRGDNIGHGTDEPLHTISAQGTHFGEVRAFLIAYYGHDKEGQQLGLPIRTVPTHDRFGLVTVHGEEYAIVDIGMRMLVPRELFRAQGFGDSYVIDPLVAGKPFTKTAQVRMAGNSVCPPLAEALVRANFVEAEREEQAA